MILEQLYLGCLSQASYLIGDEASGEAAVVDPRRDIDEYLEQARARGLSIRHVLLTHFHADFVSGHLELRDRCGATIYLGEGAAAEYDFRTLADGDTIEIGAVKVQALSTPGHTPESTSYLVYDTADDAENPKAVLTGDTLFIGDVGRPDLMASQGITADELASSLYDSLHEKLMVLPDETIVYPGHGAGSACGKNLSTDTWSTMGAQRARNYALQPMAREEFVKLVTADQPPAPGYFAHDASYNRRERVTLEENVDRAMNALSLDEVLALRDAGAQVLDTRSPDAFAAGHLRGSVHVGIDGRFASWVGTVLDAARDTIVITDEGRQRETLVRLGRIGFDRVAGYLDGGSGVLGSRPDETARFERLRPRELEARLGSDEPPALLDIRGPGERAAGYIEGSLHIPLPELTARLDEVPRGRPLVLLCASGYRSTIAASLLRREGLGEPTDLAGGLGAWESGGHALETGDGTGCGIDSK